MKNEWFAYIKIAENESYIESTGITFSEFYQGIEGKPKSILLLKGFPDDAVYHRNIGLEYIPPETIADFTKSNVYDFGDFCWVDFHDSKQLDALTDEQLAELLFFAHKAKPLKSLCFSDLGNQYAYYSHDDGWFVRLFMKDVKRYASVIAYKILTELKGRKKYISPLPADILDRIYDLAKEGIVIDFENRYTTGVRIYKIGSLNDMDGIHSMLDKYRKSMHGLCLDYNSKSKTWSTY